MNFMDILKEKREIVFNELIKYIPDKEPKKFWEIVRDYPMRKGKYLRPTLVLLSCEMLGGDPQKAVKTAAAMQLSEEWLLVHDDIQDDSDERRGKPAIHKIHGIEHAVNAGDTLHLIMWKILYENRNILDIETTFKIFERFYNTLQTTAEGQFLEMDWTQNVKEDFSEEDYYRIAESKAGWYTIITPMLLGGIVANAPEEKLKILEEIGLPLGVAFQIQDDVLNLTAERDKYGKEIAGDIWEGKLTLMFAHLIKNCTPEEKKKILSIYRKSRKEKTEEEIKYVLDLMKKYGSIEYAKKKARELANKAKETFEEKLKDVPENNGKKALRAAIDFIVEREL